jgi:hypothetical protein
MHESRSPTVPAGNLRQFSKSNSHSALLADDEAPTQVIFARLYQLRLGSGLGGNVLSANQFWGDGWVS